MYNREGRHIQYVLLQFQRRIDDSATHRVAYNMPNHTEALKSLRKELKEWEHSFINIQSRSPTKHDIKANAAIQQKYKEYSRLKKLAIRKRSPRKYAARSPASRSTIRSPLPTQQSQAAFIEIGPTPQIYGKSISIFELNLSPVKKRLKIPLDDEPLDDSSTKVESEATEFDFGDSPFVESSPEPETAGVGNEDVVQKTAVSNVFASVPNTARLKPPVARRYGPNSPLKLPTDISVAERLRTPRKKRANDENNANTNLLVTPPLWKRSISKPLKQLEDEYREMVKSFVPDEAVSSASQPVEAESKASQTENDSQVAAETTPADNALSDIQKVRRRKGRIRRFEDSATKADGNGVKINLHKQMHRLKKKQLRKILKELDMEDTMELSEDEEEDDAADTMTKAKKPARRKKYNLVSNNFRRLKLPSRQRNNFMKRFRRR